MVMIKVFLSIYFIDLDTMVQLARRIPADGAAQCYLHRRKEVTGGNTTCTKLPVKALTRGNNFISCGVTIFSLQCHVIICVSSATVRAWRTPSTGGCPQIFYVPYVAGKIGWKKVSSFLVHRGCGHLVFTSVRIDSGVTSFHHGTKRPKPNQQSTQTCETTAAAQSAFHSQPLRSASSSHCFARICLKTLFL